MPIYEDETTSRQQLFELRKRNKCKECGARLNVFFDAERGKAFLACWDWLRTHHDDGIEREARPPFEPNILTRREMMNQEYGEARTRALEKYSGVVSLTKLQAREILETVFPEAPDSEIARAVLLCASYGLNPLMKHVFLIKFNKWNKEHTRIIGEEWATVMGIKAKRLLSSRKGTPSYVDDTPRVMTEHEQLITFGEVEADKLWVITKGKDPQTGAEAVGYGFWPREDKPYGTEKGNTKFNMASIRSESQMLDRLRPGEMPHGIGVIDEEYIGADYQISRGEEPPPSMTEGEEKIGEPTDMELGGEGGSAPTNLSSPKGVKSQKPVERAVEATDGQLIVDPDWLNQVLKEIKWTEDTAKSWIANTLKVDAQGSLTDILHRLTRDQTVLFVKELEDRAAKVQPGFWG